MTWAWPLRAAALWLALVGVATAQPALLTLRQAQLIEVQGGLSLAPQPIELPLHWDISHRDDTRSSRADLVLPFSLPAPPDPAGGPYTLFIARLGNAYQLELNGITLQTAGALDMPRERWSAKQPVTVNFPADLLRADNELRVRLRADFGRRGGLSEVVVGPMRLVVPVAERQERWRVSLPQAASVFSLMVAFFCAVLWWQHRDPLYAWAGFGEALWAAVVADTVIETAPLPWPAWGLVLVLLRGLWLWSLYAVAQQVFGPRPKGERWTVLAVLLAVPLCALAAAVLRSTLPLRLGYLSVGVVWTVVVVRLAWLAARQPASDRILFVLALVACVVAGVRDAIAARWDATLYDEPAWVKFMAPLVGVAVMWIVSVRFRRARSEVVQLNATLAQRIEQKERELRDSFERLSLAESARAVADERARILRDMHDGVGSHLATAMRQLESGRAHPTDVAQTLRESLDRLKLSIDAMNLPRGDVGAMLASLRYRLQGRIESVGLSLQWRVDRLPPWLQPSDDAMRHLQFMLFEAISNVLQHARASVLQIEATAADDRIHVCVRDDGCGLGRAAGEGLRSMRERAQLIGAELVVEAGEPGTRVRIGLPALH